MKNKIVNTKSTAKQLYILGPDLDYTDWMYPRPTDWSRHTAILLLTIVPST